MIVGDGNLLIQSDGEIVSAVKGSNLVLLGMSSPAENAEPEILAGKNARALGIPYGFYGDRADCWNRKWFHDLATDASFYFGPNEVSVEGAKAVFPKAKLFATGNPLYEAMAFPEFTREQVREKLGIQPDEKLILAPGGRFSGGGDIISWTLIMEALASLTEEGHKFQLAMTPHPGDSMLFAVDSRNLEKKLNPYEELVKLSPVPARMLYKAEMPSSHVLVGTDLVIQFGSSLGREAACQRIPVITLGFNTLFNYWKSEAGSDRPDELSEGFSELVDRANISELASMIDWLLSSDGFAELKSKQELSLPVPAEQGATIKNMVEALETVLASRA